MGKKDRSDRTERSTVTGGSSTTDDSNAYDAADDWTVDDLGTLTSSIQQHAANLRGEEDDGNTGQLETGATRGLEARPVSGLAGTGASTRSFTSLTSGKSGRSLTMTDDAGGKTMGTSSTSNLMGTAQPKSALRQTNRYTRLSGQHTNSSGKQFPSLLPTTATTTTTLNSTRGGMDRLRATPKQPSVRKPPRPTVATNTPSKHATKIRAFLALVCLLVSVSLALVGGHGNWGLWLTRSAVGSPGTTAVEAGPGVAGLPGATGNLVYNGTFEIPNLEAMNIVLNAEVESNLADWRIPFPAGNRTEMPLFWDVAKSGGSVVKRILGQCLGLVQVSNLGAGHTENVSIGIEALDTTLDGNERTV